MLALLLSLSILSPALADTNCVVCVLGLALVQQLNNTFTSDPEKDCKALGFCSSAPADATCTLFNGTWPVRPAPFPTDGGATDGRRALAAAPPAATAPLAREDVLAFLAHLAAAPADGATEGLYGVVSAFSRYVVSRALPTFTPPCSDGLDVVCDFERPFSLHLPMVDHDGDAHSGDPLAGDFLTLHFRGRSWSGRDCNDSDSTVYPGRLGEPGSSDNNCNGIYGTDPVSGTPYEELFCSGANAPMGFAIVGDSATAHFHIPPQYLNAPTFNLSNILEMAANEADWPACSWATAFRNASSGACPTLHFMPNGTETASFYQRWVARNRCAHRDYTNIGVNGARTGSMKPPNGVINALTRNASADSPLLLLFSLIGNDVCNGHPGTSQMTTVAEFQANVISSLDYLEATLPAGSHVAFLGLADGRVLYDTTQSRTHPLGVPFPSVYNFLDCNGCSPCWGWLNVNSTWRDATSARAAALSAVYPQIIAANSSRYTKFDMYNFNVNWPAFIADYAAAGGDPFDLIEPVDGCAFAWERGARLPFHLLTPFLLPSSLAVHPSQTGNMLLADILWKDLAANKPDWLPPINPNNDKIQQLFGDQGGY